MQKMNEYQQRDYDNMVMLAQELSAYYPSKVVADDDHHIIVMTRGDKAYQVRKDYRGIIDAWEYPHTHYEHVSNSTAHEIRKKYPTQNMRVLSQKKIDAKLDAVDAYHAEMREKESEATDKTASFIREIEASGLPVQWEHETSTDWVNNERVVTKGKRTGGRIIKNGIEFSFSFSHDGYISKDMEIHYSVTDTLENFIALSNNQYTV